MLINVKMSSVVGILTIINMINTTYVSFKTGSFCCFCLEQVPMITGSQRLISTPRRCNESTLILRHLGLISVLD